MTNTSLWKALAHSKGTLPGHCKIGLRSGKTQSPYGLVIVALASLLLLTNDVGAAIVRFNIAIGPTLRTFDVRLFDTAMPRSVANFLKYAADDDWAGAFFHRSALNFVVQGGGFSLPETGLFASGSSAYQLVPVPTDAPINDEPGGNVRGPSNIRGTLAMAKSGPNTATSQWFFNLRDNSSLDNPGRPDGGFSAFGRVLAGGMSAIDAIAALSRINFGSDPLTEVPVVDVSKVQSQRNLFNADTVRVLNIRKLLLPDADYSLDGVVDAQDLAAWEQDFGSLLLAEADGNGNVSVDGADMLLWQRGFGQTTSSSSVSAIPEPSAWILGVLGLIGYYAHPAAFRRRGV